MEALRDRLAEVLKRGWWSLLLRGLVAIAFAVLTWLQPQISLTALVYVFGFYALVDGILAAGAAIAGRNLSRSWWMLLLSGLVGIAVGVLTFMRPGITALGLLVYIAIWAIGTGLFTIFAAIRLRKEIQNEWILILNGLAALAFGGLLVARPGAGALAVLWLIATLAFILGITLVMLAFRVRSLGKLVGTGAPAKA